MIAVDASAFKTWLDGAKIGDELVYHVGDLASETDPEAWAKARVLALNALLDEVLAAKKDGRVKLRQEIVAAKRAFSHIARRIA